MAGELSNCQTGSQVSSGSAISSALSSYDDSSQVDSKIVMALLDFYNRAETDQAIADAASSSVDLSAYYTSAPNGHALLPPHGAGFVADSNSDPVLDVGKDPNGDRRRPRGLRVPGPNRGRCPVSGASPGRGVGSDFQLGAGAVHAPHRAEPTS